MPDPKEPTLDEKILAEVLGPRHRREFKGPAPHFSVSVPLCFGYVIPAMTERGFALVIEVHADKVSAHFLTAGGLEYHQSVKNEPGGVAYAICAAALKAVRESNA